MSVKRFGYGCEFDGNSGPFVTYEDYAALEARCAALAAEVQAVKDAVIARIKLHEEIRNAGRPPHTDFWHQSIYMADKKVEDSLSSTPNHDAFLAEVRAQGVEMFAERKNNEMMSLHPDTHAVGSIAAEMSSQVKQLREFAEQIRKGVQS